MWVGGTQQKILDYTSQLAGPAVSKPVRSWLGSARLALAFVWKKMGWTGAVSSAEGSVCRACTGSTAPSSSPAAQRPQSLANTTFLVGMVLSTLMEALGTAVQ